MLKKPKSKTPLLSLLRKKENWTKNMSFRSSKGRSCNMEKASSCCIYGGLDICYPATGKLNIELKIENAIKELFPDRPWFIDDFNDSRETTHVDVVKMLKKAGV